MRIGRIKKCGRHDMIVVEIILKKCEKYQRYEMIIKEKLGMRKMQKV